MKPLIIVFYVDNFLIIENHTKNIHWLKNQLFS
jgi:hypothetical protein